MRNPRPFPDALHTIFKQLDPETFQQFVQAQQHWTALQRMAELETHIDLLQEELAENDMQLKWLQPSAVALAAIARFQAYGVDDFDLLDTMLERGETWLDQTLQLLEQCERLNLIGGNYTAWCEHALEGAYDWIASMHSGGDDAESTTATMLEDVQQNGHQESTNEITEEMLIRRLMSEDETEKLAAMPPQPVASNNMQAQATSSDTPALPQMLAAPAAPVEVADAADIPAPSDMPAEALAIPEAPIAADLPAETSGTSEGLAVPDSSDEGPATLENLVASDILAEVTKNAELVAVADISAETLDTPKAPVAANIPVEVADAHKVHAVADISPEALDTPETLVASDTIIAAADVPEVATISDAGAETSELLVETANAPEILETVETPDEKTDTVEAADEPLEETLQTDAGASSEEASPSWEEHEAAVEALEAEAMPDEPPMEAQPAASVVPTTHENDALDDPLEHAAPSDREEHNELFNEYIETVDDLRSETTDTGDVQPIVASTHGEAVSEEQRDPFTVDGSVTYLPTHDAVVQAVPDTSLVKPKRRFFLWRLLARIFRRASKKTP